MAGNGKVFISHSHEDTARCAPLLAALEAWGVDYWFDTQGLGAGQQLTERIQREITQRDVFLRVCTAATQRSFWMNLEANAFRGLQAEDRRHRRGDKRLLINLILDGDYSREPFDNATLFIDAASRPRAVWLAELGRALDVTAPTRARVSRRSVLGYTAAAAVTLSSTAAAGALFLDYRSRTEATAAAAATAKHAPGKVVWKIDQASGKKDVPAAPVVAAGKLYVMNGYTLTAYDLASVAHGKPRQLWQKQFSPKFTFVVPDVEGSVVFAAVDWSLYALRASDGSTLWTSELPKSDTGTINSTPLLVGNTIYLLSEKGNLYAFDAKGGAPLWTDPIELAPHLLDTASGPVVDESSLYIGSYDHHLYTVSAKDGSPLWNVLTHGKIISTPAVVNGVVYFGSGDNYIYALHAHDGSVKWKYLTGDDVQSSPAVVDGVVYIASNDGYLYALDADTGSPYWRAPVGDLDESTGIIDNKGPVTCRPAISGDAVCVIDTLFNIVRAYTRHDGSARWTFKSKSYANVDPIAADGLILFGSGDQTLYAFGA
ncbi:MAG TPA: PQQ-binding-like beta-propeller repeat protein [Ktedonobacterales bacterium]|nr:PQQ-binding-like beta-propeller repeat protein [Ktedonobacterales bacterium]